MAKLVCHAEKYKKGSVSSIERHNERKNTNYSNEEIDPLRTHLNYSLIQRDDESYYRSVMKLVNARDNPSGRTLRKDAVVLCEVIISSSNEFFDTLPTEEQRRFLKKQTITCRISLEKRIVFTLRFTMMSIHRICTLALYL